MQNCCNGVQLQFQRLTSEADVKWVKTNINQATSAYHEGHCVTFGTKSVADQREAVQLLKGLKDGKQTVTVTAIMTEQDKDGLHIEPPQPGPLNMQSDTSVQPMQVDATEKATMDPGTEARFQRLETDVERIKDDVHGINNKMDTMAKDIISELRKSDTQTSTQPPTPPPPADNIIKRPKDLGKHVKPPTVGSFAWVVRKEATATRVPLRVLVTAVPSAGQPHFVALAHTAEGNLDATKPIQCAIECFMTETEARNLPSVA